MEKDQTKTPEPVQDEVLETEEGVVEEAPEENSELKELQKKLEETNDKLLRTLAEYDNFRKRSQKEKEAMFGDIKADTISRFLPVIDNFERAALSTGDFEAYKKGIEMTVSQLLDVLKNLGVSPFGEKGEVFDPNLHNGVMHEENEELGENTVSDVFLKGYKMGDKIIRHATVKVAN